MRIPLRRALCLALLTYAPSVAAQLTPHFDDCTALTGGNASLIVPLNASLTVSSDSVAAEPVAEGDELAVVTPEGACAGALTWDEAAAALAVWEDDPMTAPKDGFLPGDTLTYRLWDASSEQELTATSVRYAVPSEPSGRFDGDAVYFLSELTFAQTHGVDNEGYEGASAEFAFEPNYPNPFTASTTFRYAIPEPAHVRLDLYDLLGRRIAAIVDEHMPAGWHEVSVEADGLAGGSYIARLTTGTHADAQRITLVR